MRRNTRVTLAATDARWATSSTYPPIGTHGVVRAVSIDCQVLVKFTEPFRLISVNPEQLAIVSTPNQRQPPRQYKVMNGPRFLVYTGFDGEARGARWVITLSLPLVEGRQLSFIRKFYTTDEHLFLAHSELTRYCREVHGCDYVKVMSLTDTL